MMRTTIKSALLAGAAVAAVVGISHAADLAARPPVLAAVGINWDGFYVGYHTGYAYGRTNWTDPRGYYALAPTDIPAGGTTAGALLGGQLGFNKQFGPWVFGVEGDVSLGSFDGYANCNGNPATGFGTVDYCHTRSNVLASIGARAGYAMGRSLVYVKAGGAYTNDKYDTGYPYPSYPAFDGQVGSTSRFGYTVGAGVEYQLSPEWSWKAEYAYYDFGTKNEQFAFPLAPGGITGGWTIRHTENLVKFGLNYRFYALPPGGVSDPVGPIASDLSGEFGGRTGYTTGSFRKNLFSPTVPGQMNSRLTWQGQDGVSTEGWGRVDHTLGFFAKGFVGGADLFKSHMHDEDFPPAIVPYSNKISQTKNGRDVYASADLGYTFLRGRYGLVDYRLGVFGGYLYMQERLNAFGCNQVAGNQAVCGTLTVPSISPAEVTLAENEHWQTARVGLGGDVTYDRFKLYAEGAYTPWVAFHANDNHWLRPNINPLDEDARGHTGFQTEAVLSYAYTDRLSFGVGGRYWQFRANGHTQFVGSPPSPENFAAHRATVFFQTAYKFGGDPAPAVIAKY